MAAPRLQRFLPSAWSPECWSPPYFRDRLRAACYTRLHPHLPWLPRDANNLLLSSLSPHDRVLEFGAGRSTPFFARHCAHIVSIEHNPHWHARVRARIRTPNIDLRLAPPSEYPQQARAFPDHSFSIILIDGIRRADCVLEALPKLAPAGLLVIDNINRHLPNHSPGPGSLRAWDLSNPEHQKWRRIQQLLLAHHSQTWISSGVTDTLFARDPRQG